MAALAGAAGGAAAGGLTGALVGMGIPEYEAKRYEGKVKDGNILLSVTHALPADFCRAPRFEFNLRSDFCRAYADQLTPRDLEDAR
jgi:hypothetical protein